MKVVFTKRELKELKYYQSLFSNVDTAKDIIETIRLKQQNPKLNDDYSKIPLRKRFILIRTLYENLMIQKKHNLEI